MSESELAIVRIQDGELALTPRFERYRSVRLNGYATCHPPLVERTDTRTSELHLPVVRLGDMVAEAGKMDLHIVPLLDQVIELFAHEGEAQLIDGVGPEDLFVAHGQFRVDGD